MTDKGSLPVGALMQTIGVPRASRTFYVAAQQCMVVIEQMVVVEVQALLAGLT